MVNLNEALLDSLEQGLEHAGNLLQKEVDAKRLMGAALQVSKGGMVLDTICAGRRRLPGDGPRVEADTIFLVASITKPLVAAAVMRLVEEGKLVLSDPVRRYVPEFGANGKEGVKLFHCLTHTSGLPDQIDLTREYRQAKRPLVDYVARICTLPLRFQPGTKISYQSCGFAMLGEILERVEGVPLRDYMRTHFFEPLELQDTFLGIPQRLEREADIKIGGEGLSYGGDGGTDFDWNSSYWRGLGAPWGGLLTTVGDLTTLLQAFLAGGTLKGARLLHAGSVRTMLTDQTSNLPGVTLNDPKGQRYGFGWHLQSRHLSTYGDLVSDRTFGHHGATGTVAWADPETDVTFVLFTNDPDGAQGLKGRICNLVAGAVSG